MSQQSLAENTIYERADIVEAAKRFLNARSIKRRIGDDEILDVRHESVLMFEGRFGVQARYSYQGGVCDTAAYQDAVSQYKRDFQIYQMARNQYEAERASAETRAEQARKAGLPFTYPHLIQPDEPDEPQESDYVEWGAREYGDVRKELDLDSDPSVILVANECTLGDADFAKLDALRDRLANDRLRPIPEAPESVSRVIDEKFNPASQALANVLVDEALENYYHRDVQTELVAASAGYRVLALDGWVVQFKNGESTGNVYVDEVGATIGGDKLTEDASVLWVYAKNLGLLALLIWLFSFVPEVGWFMVFVMAVVFCAVNLWALRFMAQGRGGMAGRVYAWMETELLVRYFREKWSHQMDDHVQASPVVLARREAMIERMQTRKASPWASWSMKA